MGHGLHHEAFPSVYWPTWDADVTFLPGTELPEASEGRLWAVLTFVFYGDKVVLGDIPGRGMCIPSGRIEPGETIDAAAVREAFEETGAILSPDGRRLIGCFRLVPRQGTPECQPRYCPVFVAEALGFQAIPSDSESQGMFLAAIEDVSDIYFFWDALIAAVFEYADEQRQRLFPVGIPISSLFG